jgi:K+/H+ antiporter YhaU regulatory subunit KhtT
VNKVDKKDMVVYVKLDDYNDIMDIVRLVKGRLKEARFLLGKISDLKKEEEAEIEGWASELDSVEEKLDIIDKTLAEPEV